MRLILLDSEGTISAVSTSFCSWTCSHRSACQLGCKTYEPLIVCFKQPVCMSCNLRTWLLSHIAGSRAAKVGFGVSFIGTTALPTEQWYQISNGNLVLQAEKLWSSCVLPSIGSAARHREREVPGRLSQYTPPSGLTLAQRAMPIKLSL